MVKALHRTLKAVTHDIDNMLFNTAISRMMEFVNAAYKAERIDRSVAGPFVLALSPFAPHLAEELWERLGNKTSLAYEPWPKHNEALLEEDTIEIPVQVNGKLRGVVSVAKDAAREAVLASAKADAKIVVHLEGKTIVKEVFVPGKLLNFVVK
ncbi:MAG: class I tRNA ligase family protein [Candidatus Hydrogenedentes bacterium]|nr:class I tRNA ligase family protein [Candidatus Hydrogenedentota bacterium]